MKPYILLLLLITLILPGCASPSVQHDSWFGEDKAGHFLISAAIAGTATAIGRNEGKRSEELLYFSLGLTLSLGAGKEAFDMRYGQTGWSWKDLAWDLLGAISGYGIVQAVE